MIERVALAQSKHNPFHRGLHIERKGNAKFPRPLKGSKGASVEEAQYAEMDEDRGYMKSERPQNRRQ